MAKNTEVRTAAAKNIEGLVLPQDQTQQRFEGLERDMEGFRNFIRKAHETEMSHAELIRMLREDLDTERQKVKTLELKIDNLYEYMNNTRGSMAV